MTPEKQKAIAWLQDEIRSLRLAPTINGCEMKPEWAEQLEIMKTCLEAVKKCDQNETEMRPDCNTPLTLEQLREMEKPTPVWMESKKKTIEGWGGYWCLCARGHIITPGLISMYADKMDGAEFYAYQPAHIDREAWTAEWKDHYRSGIHAGSGCVCSYCDMWSGRKSHICPNCGKAMDEYGLTVLEKRLRG